MLPLPLLLLKYNDDNIEEGPGPAGGHCRDVASNEGLELMLMPRLMWAGAPEDLKLEELLAIDRELGVPNIGAAIHFK